jgi:hypothetical protein
MDVPVDSEAWVDTAQVNHQPPRTPTLPQVPSDFLKGITDRRNAFPGRDAFRDELYQRSNSISYVIAEITKGKFFGFLAAQDRHIL